MKSLILFTSLFFLSIFCYSIDITIAKGENTPDNVCNEADYGYTATSLLLVCNEELTVVEFVTQLFYNLKNHGVSCCK